MSPLLNYSTEVGAARTVAEIEKILSQHGATSIFKQYDKEGMIKALAFTIDTPLGQSSVRLPVDPEATLRVMCKSGSGVPPRYQNQPQAVRVAWRQIKDWVEAQMALLETEMVKFDQIFLPYIETPKGTVYELFKAKESQLLGSLEVNRISQT